MSESNFCYRSNASEIILATTAEVKDSRRFAADFSSGQHAAPTQDSNTLSEDE